MDVRLSAEQRALRDAAVQLVDRLAPRTVAEIGDADRGARLDAAVTAAGWRELRAAGDGGAAPLASAVEVAILAEELGRRLADVAFIGPTLAADLRRRAGAGPGGPGETVALTADLARPAPAGDGALSTAAVAFDAGAASGALALAPAPGGWALAEVEVPAGAGAGVDLTRPTVALDRDAKARPLAPDSAAVPAAQLESWTALGLAVACADLVGTMRGALDLAAGYARERRQYGVAIGSFQAVQHLLADALVAVEGSRSVSLHAAWAVDARPAPEALAAAAVAKAWCARAARTVCETAIQVHGGIGNTWDCLAHAHLRRALVSSELLGGEGPCLARVLGHHRIDQGSGGDGLR